MSALKSEKQLAGKLDDWVDPIAPLFFQQAYWKKVPLFVKGGPDRLEELRAAFLGLDLSALLQSAGKPDENCIRAWWLNNGRNDTRLQVQPAQALILFDADFTLYFEPKASAVLKLFEELMVGSGNPLNAAILSVFASKKGHFTPTHTDNNENFTIQLSGAKEWIVGHESAPETKKFFLEPGDMLYCPGPWAHSVRALEDSISLNLSFIKQIGKA
ncbi:MAG: hypothetical protein EOP11_13315 [Proteobacteria bacterium]|nr:MAG: hypothetical protein EOP11_13315 [Pseudomonadota bacterium]